MADAAKGKGGAAALRGPSSLMMRFTMPRAISAPGYYYLSPSINPVVTGLATAITITASNAVLDMNGINIVATNGIFISGTNSRISFVTIQNGSITALGCPSLQPTSASF